MCVKNVAIPIIAEAGSLIHDVVPDAGMMKARQPERCSISVSSLCIWHFLLYSN
jgi:hypothetical protein